MENKNYFKPLIIVGLLFFVLGFAVGINNILIPFLRQAFGLTTTSSYLVMAATYTAFVVFGYPSGLIIRKIGYKKAIGVSFFIFAAGMYLFIPAAQQTSFSLFLFALFVGGLGNTLLQTAVNPYITILGPQEGGAKRLSLMGICNKCANALAPVILALFLNLNQVELNDVMLPFYLITAIMIVSGFVSFFLPLPEVTAAGEVQDQTQTPSAVMLYANSKKNIWQFPHLVLGAFALFADVGLEMIALGTIVDYANHTGLPHPETYTIYTTVFMVSGYICGIFLIPKLLSQQRALLYCSVLGVVLSVLIITMPQATSVWFVAATGLSASLLWPVIWPLAIADLGKYTKTGSSILVVAIVGGAVIPLLFGYMADVLQRIQLAYSICIPLYAYLIFYAVKGHRLR